MLCKFCKKEFSGKKGQKFCSRSCAARVTRTIIRPKDFNRIKSLYDHGQKISNIASEFNVSEETIRKLLHKLETKIRPKGTKYQEGARKEDSRGYILIKKANKWVLEHRFVMSEFIGREIKNNEHVHHKDGNRKNNNVDNLEIITRTQHGKLHHGVGNDKIKEIQELYRSKTKVREIAIIMQVSTATIYKYIEELPKRNPGK